MKKSDSASHISTLPYSNIRNSQSLHAHLIKNKRKYILHERSTKNIDYITVCILFKKKKIQFGVKSNTSFEDLNKQLYQELYEHLLVQTQNNHEKAQKVLQTVVGFQSVDEDINFDYRLSLNKGTIQKTKFFYPLLNKTHHNQTFKYKIYNCLAIGGFSKVYLARSLQNGQFYAIKFMKKVNPSNNQAYFDKEKFQSMKNQVSVCDELDHPFLVRMIEAFETQNFYCLVFDYCPGGELFFLLKRFRVMDESMARFYFLQILLGMQYLHSKNIVYRDLKPENIMIDADGNCKLIDFGLSKRIDSRTKTFSYCGSAQYMAPEMILRTGHSFGVDHYSLGAFLYQLVTGLPPYYTKNHEQLQQSIICKDLTFPAQIELSQEIKDLLQKLLKKEEKIRLGSYIGVKQIMIHPWIGKVKSIQILDKSIKSPFVPNLEEYNFDLTQLGDDEEEFTALVRQDTSKKNCIVKSYIHCKVNKDHLKEFIEKNIEKHNQSDKQNKSGSNYTNNFTELFRKRSKDNKEKKIFRSQRGNLNDKTDDAMKKNRQICRLSPYFNCNKISPKKRKEMIELLEHRLVKMDKVPNKMLKRIKIDKNRMINQAS